MASSPLKSANPPHQDGHSATPCQAGVQQQTNTESFWVAPLDDPIALFTLVLAIAAIFQLVANILLWVTTRNAVRLGRDEFNASHRPKLRVRNIVVKPAAQGPGQMTLDPFHPGYHISGQFFLSNIGDAAARITESHCEVYWGGINNVGWPDRLPMQRPYEGKDGNNPIAPQTLASGQAVTGLFFSEQPFPVLNWDPQKRSGLFVMGWIEYLDERGIRRRTAFCREYLEREGARRFYPVDDPDYEHEE
jgi:hypothetical protein